MMEVGAVIDWKYQVIHWHMPADRTGGSLPDSPDLWNFLWENRKEILGFAHSHPGGGVPAPSYTDVTTFAAIEAALGVRLSWWITSETHLVYAWWTGLSQTHYQVSLVEPEYPWAAELRERSLQMKKEVRHAST